MKIQVATLQLLRLAVACLLGAVAASASAQALLPVRFQHDWRIDGSVTIYEVARAKGYFAQEGLAVTIDPGTGSAATVNRLASGAYDLGQGDVLSLMEIAAKSPELGARVKVVFQLWADAPAAVIALKKSAIRTPADLRGKKIAAPAFDGGRRLFPLLEKANGLASKDVSWMTVDPALREQLLSRGDVEAIAGFVFAVTNLNRLGVKDEELTVMRYTDFGVHVPGQAILASTAFAKAHPEALKGFLRAVTKGLRDTIADPAAAIRMVKAREPLVDEALELKRLKLIISDGYGAAPARAQGIGSLEKGTYDKALPDIAAAYGLQTVPQYADLFDFQYLPSADTRLVFGKP